jgi:hypothetical protein
MLTWYLEKRHWSPREGYATGEALLSLLDEGWHINSAMLAPGENRFPLYLVTLKRSTDILTVLVLDGPVAREVLPL